jgi:cytosine/adenosine deaminase-related metal-dependent hydrolase
MFTIRSKTLQPREANMPNANENDATTRFASAQDAWFWTVGALRARREGARRGGGPRIPRPCDPDDVIRAVDRLWRDGRLNQTHLRVMRLCGERGLPPEPARPAERLAARLWEEAMGALAVPLRAKGIVGDGNDAWNSISRNYFLDSTDQAA